MKFYNDVFVELVQHVGDDRSVANAARVSVIGEQTLDREFETKDAGLINFLVRDRHGSPFEHNSMTFFIKAPIFVFREFHRHRVGWSYNEMSGRYTQLEPEFYIPNESRPLVQVGKPGAYSFEPGEVWQTILVGDYLKTTAASAWERYTALLAGGVAKEVARMVLPVNIFSQMYATCNARSLMHFLSLRTKDDSATFKSFPQVEIEMVARKMETIFAQQFPFTYNAWLQNGRVAP